MKEDLTDKHAKELDALRQKYENMIKEMQRNAENDKDFVQNELRKKILTLEKQIDDMRKEHGDEKEKLMKQMQETVKKFEDQINQLKNEQRTKLADMQNDHSREINTLQTNHEAALDALRKALSSDS